MNDKPRNIQERFPDEKHSIDQLMAEDPEFLDLCEDYEVCVNALRYWTASSAPVAKTRVEEYGILVQELEAEIAQALNAVKPRRLD